MKSKTTKQYPFWQLLRAQWCWKNELETLCIAFFVGCILNFVATAGIPTLGTKDTLLLLTVFTGGNFSLYQGFKFVIMGVLMKVVSSAAESGETSAQDLYKKALTWRK